MTSTDPWLRRALLSACLMAFCGAAAAFGFDDVAAQAASAAARPHATAETPKADPAAARLAALSYDEYRRVRFREARSLWRGSGTPFEVQFYPLGRSFTRAPAMAEIVDGEVRPIVVRASSFDTQGVLPPEPGDPETGVAGWRLTYPLNRADKRDEVIAFLGASYFRALGAGQRYGLSARGLAIDTVGAGAEEFPAFTKFWLQRPAADAQELVFYALLEGPRVTGAYRFAVRPGTSTVVDVQARLYLRSAVSTLGVAPLTSMFLMGENQPVADDYRPEVHDSDGLQIASGDGEWLWRPLINPRSAFVSSFTLKSPRGFGLMQRDRSFTSYEDLEAHYERRPGVWVEPLGDWGAGRVELLQFHTPNETHDNVVAYWVPETLPAPGVPLNLSWRLHWSGDDQRAPPGARVVQTRQGHGYRETPIPREHLQFHLDFAGANLPTVGSEDTATEAENNAVQAVATGNDNVRKLRAIAYPNRARGGWRVTLDLERLDTKRPVELRVFLKSGGQVLSETWSHVLAPE